MLSNQAPANNMQGLLSRFQQFRNTFSGNPQQQIQQMLNSGKITQSQLDAAVQQAQQFKNMLGIK
jgi:hypothetical protein